MIRSSTKWRLAVKILPISVGVVLLKFALHRFGWEAIHLNPIFPGLLAATVFLLGFLVSGVLTDYKESERLPGEIAVSLEALAGEAGIVWRNKKAPEAMACMKHVEEVSGGILEWIRGESPFDRLMDRVTDLDRHLAALEPLAPPPFIVRMKQEQTSLRRQLIRINVIRETSFIGSGYAIAEIISCLLILAFTLAMIEPFGESLFIVGLITFLLTYMLALIRDLDNPFDYTHDGRGGGEEVSLSPLEDVQGRIGRLIGAFDGVGRATGPPVDESP